MDPQTGMAATATPRLLDQIRNVIRLHHYSIHTERTYTEWIKRSILQQGGHGVASPLDDL